MSGMCRRKSRDISEFVTRDPCFVLEYLDDDIYIKTVVVDDSDAVRDNGDGFCGQSDCAWRPC